MIFPLREDAIVRLAQDVAAGLAAHPDVFPSPIITPEEMHQVLADYNAVRDARQAALAAVRDLTARKREVLRLLKQLTKAAIKYAEIIANGDQAKLDLIRWVLRRRALRNGRVVPGQVMSLVVRQEGRTWAVLEWRPPVDGGPVSAYRIQRRRRAEGDWIDDRPSVDTSATLHNQETGVELEYRVIAVNEVGDGPASNVVRVVL